jgi:4-amino-4-deoxy-L-arabinose transferase-like glycosyltransferase
MGLLGENLFALRYVNVIFGLLAIAVSYTWAKRAFDERVGLLTAVLLAISFWPLASSREALRAGMLPFFMGTAVWLFWKIAGEQRSRGAEGQTSLSDYRLPITDYQLPITNYRLPITDYRLPSSPSSSPSPSTST